MGVHFGDDPEADTVTVAKMRTMFQTQVLKMGETDVSRADRMMGGREGVRLVSVGRGRYPFDEKIQNVRQRSAAMQTVQHPWQCL